VHIFRVTAIGAGPPATPLLSALPDKPSVAVLPFANMSGDLNQEFFADGIAEDIITALSRYPSLFVIARNSTFTYKGQTIDVRQVGRELGVRYVLEGSVRKSGNRLRVTAQLVDAEVGKHVWADRYDHDLADIFALQDQITEAVTIAVAPAIADAELQRAMRKAPRNLDAWGAYQHGLWHLSQFTADDNALAQKFFQQAIDFDPTFGGGFAGLARAQFHAAARFQTNSLADTQSSTESSARRAVALDGADAEARSCLAAVLLRRGDHEGAVAEAERALSMAPNLASAHGVLGASLMYSGRPREGLLSLQTSIRLGPRDPSNRLHQVVLALYFSREYAAAVEAAHKAIRAYTHYVLTYRWLAAALVQAGRAEEAKYALETVPGRAPASFEMYVRQRPFWQRPEDHAHMIEGLRKAGWEGCQPAEPEQDRCPGRARAPGA